MGNLALMPIHVGIKYSAQWWPNFQPVAGFSGRSVRQTEFDCIFPCVGTQTKYRFRVSEHLDKRLPLC